MKNENVSMQKQDIKKERNKGKRKKGGNKEV